VRFPILITCRDRLSPLVELVTWLERSGQDRIYLAGQRLDLPAPARVLRAHGAPGDPPGQQRGAAVRLGGRHRRQALRRVVLRGHRPRRGAGGGLPAGRAGRLPRCAAALPGQLQGRFGLKIDDLPDHCRFAEEVRTWEAQFWERELAPGLYDAQIDTTFALYQRGVPFQIHSGIRTDKPYLARHTAWYADSNAPTDEERYYREHARTDVTHWNANELPAWLPRRSPAGALPRRRPRGHGRAGGCCPGCAADRTPCVDARAALPQNVTPPGITRG
jgi:hypothetical protein